MALQKQIAAFRLTGGLDTKTDPKAVPAAKLLSLTNGQFSSPGRIRKRNGFGPLGRGIATTNDRLADGLALMTYRDELLAFDPTTAYSYDASSAKWIDKGAQSSCNVTKNAISSGTYDAIGQDGATHPDGLQVFVWNAGSTGLYYSVVDSITGQTVVNATLIRSTGTRGRVLVVNNSFLVYFYDTATTLLYVATLPVGNATRTLTPTAITTSASDANSLASGFPNYDVIVATSDTVGQQIYLAFNNRTATTGGTSLWRFPVTTPTVTGGKVSIVGEVSRAITVFQDAYLGRIVLGYWNAAAVKFRSYEAALADASDVPLLVGFGLVETIAGVLTLTGASLSDAVQTRAEASFTVLNAWGAANGVVIRGTTVTTEGSQLVGGTINGTSASARWATSDTASATAAAAAINASAAGADVTAAGALGVVTITADTPGSSGNAITLAAIGTNVTASGATLAGGADGVAATGAITVTGGSGAIALNIGNVLLTPVNWAVSDDNTALLIKAQINLQLPTLTANVIANTVHVTWEAAGVVGNGFSCAGTGTGVTNANGGLFAGGADGVAASGTLTLTNARGYTDTQVATNLAAAIAANVTTAALVNVSVIGTVGTLVAKTAGTPGNAYTLAASGTGITVSGATFSGATGTTDNRLFYTVVKLDDYEPTEVDYYVRVAELDDTLNVSAYWFMQGSPWSEAVESPTDFLRSVSLAAKAFVYGDQIYVPLVHPSDEQATYFLANGDRQVVARAIPLAAGSIPTAITTGSTQTGVGAPLAGITSTDSTTFLIALRELRSGGSGSGSDAFIPGVESVAFDFFEPERSYLRAELARNLHVAGGFLSMYDGISFVEHGFFLYPETLRMVTAPGAGHTYSYVAVYEWNDNQGNLHRSAPGNALEVVTTTPISSGGGAMVIAVPTLRLTAKQNDFLTPTRTPVRLVLYRTVDLGTAYFRSAIGAAWLNDPTVDYVEITDSTEDADLVEPIYTTGGVLENIAAPPCAALTVHRNRIVLLDSENPLTLWFSKLVTQGIPAEFNDAFTIAIDPAGGDTTALGTLDDKLIVFKRASLAYVSGPGPDSTGAQAGDFSDAQSITTACGCTNPRSVVMTPVGLMFQSTKGIYLLGRDLSVSYVGAAVERYNAETVTSGVLLEDANQVRFTLGNNTALVYDYNMLDEQGVGQWSVYTNVDAIDSVIWQGLHSYLRDDGCAFVETPGVFTDAGSHIPLGLTTAWLQFGGVQGFQRVRELLVLGEYFGPHKLQVQIAYDFDPEFAQTVLIAPAEPGSYGSASPYGSQSPYGGEFPLYQYRVGLTQQKSDAVQITLQDVPDGSACESMSLSALAFEIGIKGRLRPLSASRSS